MVRRCALGLLTSLVVLACGGGKAPQATLAPATPASSAPPAATASASAAAPTTPEPAASSAPVDAPPPASSAEHGFGQSGCKVPEPATIRQGAPQVTGRLPPEVIQKVVRMNTGLFRICYENAARSKPDLAGGVTVKFVIDRKGAVTSATADSTLPSPEAVACITRAFGKVKFPKPESGIVTVIYPLTFVPAE